MTNPSLICHFEISFSFNSEPLSKKRLRDGCWKHRVACHRKINGILSVNLSFAVVYLQLLLQSFNKKIKKEAVSGALISNRSRTECLREYVSARTRLLQTKPEEIDGFETRLARFPLIISSHLHLSLSLLVPWLSFELRAASSDSFGLFLRRQQEYNWVRRLNV